MKFILVLTQFFYLIGCGKTPTSQLTEQFPILRSGPLDMEFAFIPSGTFRMGSPESEEGRGDDETLHWVKLTEDYWMQTTEVTRDQWFKVMGYYPNTDEEECYKGQKGDHPIICVSWDDIDAYIRKLNEQEEGGGYRYRLPSEAEWEYAARAYTETSYSIVGSLRSFAWYGDSSDGHTHPVKELKANTFGLYDVHGNVWEWVSDFYEKNYPEATSYSDAIENPIGPSMTEETNMKILRGGSWRYKARHCRSGFRNGSYSWSIGFGVGFRLMRTKV